MNALRPGCGGSVQALALTRPKDTDIVKPGRSKSRLTSNPVAERKDARRFDSEDRDLADALGNLVTFMPVPGQRHNVNLAGNFSRITGI
ncbi:MAG: hypothetical protein ACREDM_06960 [Methylocella sp.]